MKIKIVLLLLFFSPWIACAEAMSALELLTDSDRARGAAGTTQGISWISDVITYEDGESRTVTYKIRVHGNDALAEATAPARQKGDIILFNDRTLWFYKQGMRKPVSISPRQKLMGQAANGDIASTQYARDYEGVVVGEETVNGIPAWKLDLKAKAKNVTYEKIHYWISKVERLGIRAEFLTLSGDVFKIAEIKYGNSISIQGKTWQFVSQMLIQDAKRAEEKTIINYQTPKEENNPPSLFNVNNLVR